MVDKKRYFKNNNFKLPFDCIYKTAHLKINMNGAEVLEYNENKLIVNKYINMMQMKLFILKNLV